MQDSVRRTVQSTIGDSSIYDYFLKMRGFADALAAIGKQLLMSDAGIMCRRDFGVRQSSSSLLHISLPMLEARRFMMTWLSSLCFQIISLPNVSRSSVLNVASQIEA